jgi:ketosteroid isomerase-like protein
MKIRGTDQLAAAKELGIDRLVTGSFSVIGEAVRIDAHIVYTATGLQEGSDSVQGGLADFFDLQKKLVISVLQRMRVTPPGEDGEGDTGDADVNAYRLLLESEGEVGDTAAPTPSKPARRAKRRTPDRSSSFRAGWQRLVSLVVSPAHAADLPEETQSAVYKLLENYRTALQNKDLDRLATLYVQFPDKRRDTLKQYFENAGDLKVELIDVSVSPHGGDVIVSYTRKDKFIDRESGKPVRLEIRLTRVVVQEGGTWKIAGKP